MSIRTAAIVASVALAVTGFGLTTAGTPAAAAPRSVTAGSLQWGIKDSLLKYHLNHPNGKPTITAGGGATAGAGTRNGPGPAFTPFPASWTFAFDSGTYDAASQDLTISYRGFVLLQDTSGAPVGSPGPSGGGSPFTYLKLSNPKIVLDFDASPKVRSLFLDIQKSPTGPAATTNLLSLAPDFTPPSTLQPLTPAAPRDGVVSYPKVNTFLTAAGAQAFAGEGAGGGYSQFDFLDPVSFTATVPSGGTTATPTPEPAPAATSPPSTDSDPDAPGDTDDSKSGGVDPLPRTGIDDGSSASVVRPLTPLDGQTVAIGVHSVEDNGTGGGLALFGVAGLAALVLALSASLFLRHRRADGRP